MTTNYEDTIRMSTGQAEPVLGSPLLFTVPRGLKEEDHFM